MERKLSQEGLKTLACLTMLLDHAVLVFGGSLWLRVIGRLSFPIYCYLLTEGIQHTRDAKRYLLRLLTAALISEPVYDLVLYPGSAVWQQQNVLWTILLGCGMLLCMSKTERVEQKLLTVLPFALAAQLMHASYGGNGILMIALFALTRGMPRERILQFVGLFILNRMTASAELSVWGFKLPIQLFATLALIPISYYSGEKRTASRWLSRGFCLFYPLHLLLLDVIKIGSSL